MLAGTVVSAVIGAAVPALISEGFDRFGNDAPPSCPGAGCDGKTPKTGGCAVDSGSWEPREKNPARLQVRYSERCDAVWGRILAGGPGDQVTIHVSGGSSQEALVNYGVDQFTVMASVGETFKVTVCAVPSELADRTADWPGYCIHATQDVSWQRP